MNIWKDVIETDKAFNKIEHSFMAWKKKTNSKLQESVGKESACSAGDPGLIPGLGRSPGEGNGNPLE